MNENIQQNNTTLLGENYLRYATVCLYPGYNLDLTFNVEGVQRKMSRQSDENNIWLTKLQIMCLKEGFCHNVTAFDTPASCNKVAQQIKHSHYWPEHVQHLEDRKALYSTSTHSHTQIQMLMLKPPVRTVQTSTT